MNTNLKTSVISILLALALLTEKMGYEELTTFCLVCSIVVIIYDDFFSGK